MSKKPEKIKKDKFPRSLLILGVLIVIVLGLLALLIITTHISNDANKTVNVIDKHPLGYNCQTTVPSGVPINTIIFKVPKCWKVKFFGSAIISITSSNSYIDKCSVPNTKQHCYNPDAYIYIYGDKPQPDALKLDEQKLLNSGYELTSFKNEPAYCVTPAKARSQKLPTNIPNDIPSGLFLDGGCYIIWDGYYYNIFIDQNPNYSDIQQVYKLLESIEYEKY